MSGWRSAATAALLVFGVGAAAFAQPARPLPTAKVRATTERLVEATVFAHAGLLSLAARDSFDAVLGGHTGTAIGGGGEARLRRGPLSGVFARVDASRFREDGQRVFIFEGQVFELGVPMTVTLMPVEATGGFRYVRRGRAGRPFPLVPYAGVGVGAVQYREDAAFAEAGEHVREWFTSYHALGGLDLRMWRWLAAGLEAQYRSVPGGLGGGGVSAELDETDLGGALVRVRVGVVF